MRKTSIQLSADTTFEHPRNTRHEAIWDRNMWEVSGILDEVGRYLAEKMKDSKEYPLSKYDWVQILHGSHRNRGDAEDLVMTIWDHMVEYSRNHRGILFGLHIIPDDIMQYCRTVFFLEGKTQVQMVKIKWPNPKESQWVDYKI